MSENIPNKPGALPPKPSEISKVQPKKETVRINLPPKAMTSPTIKLPTLSSPTTSGASTASAAPVAAAQGSAMSPKPPFAPNIPPPSNRVVGGSPNRAGAPPSAGPSATVARGSVGTVAFSKMDKALAVTVAVVSVAVLGIAIFLAFFLTNQGVALS